MLPEASDHDDASRFRLAMGLAGVAMGVVSADGSWQAANPALAAMLARPADALVGEAMLAAFDAGSRDEIADHLSACVPGNPSAAPLPTRLLGCDGTPVEVLLHAARADKGEWVLQLQDVDALQRAGRAQADTEAANRRLQAFVYGVSHDLRAPLRAIDGFAAKLEKTVQAQADAGADDAFRRIRDATARMGGLIDALLELARVDRAELRPSRVDVSLLADWCAAELQDAEQQRAASVEVQPGLYVVGDERLLKLMLKQLLHNAWRFSASRPQVQVAVTGERTPAGLRLRIRDQGIGFDMAYAGKLFEPFQRLHGVDEGAGSGIGLTIAEQIATRHHGRIRAQSVVGEGATFEVELADLDNGAYA